jgi:hypothetical protein
VGRSHSATFRTKFPLRSTGDPVVITLDQQFGDQHTIGRFKHLCDHRRPRAARAGGRRPQDPDRPAAATHAGEVDRLLDEVAKTAPATEKLVRTSGDPQGRADAADHDGAGDLAADDRTRARRACSAAATSSSPGPVAPGTLASLHPFKARGETGPPGPGALAGRSRQSDHARVAVKPFWANLFGQGLVRTANDFGVRGERPTHPELLDWLATEFIRLGWSPKALIRTIVTSATYRQSSRHRAELAERDPQNYLLYRQNRWRVEGRDRARPDAGR